MAEHFIECPTRKNMAISAENRTQDQKWGSTGQNWPFIQLQNRQYLLVIFSYKGRVFAKIESEYRLTAKNNRF